MRHENLDLAQAVMDALGRRDAARLIELSDPDVEWHSFFAVGEAGGVYRGHAGTEQYMRDLGDAWEIARAESVDSLAVGDLVVLVGHIHYRGRGSGVDASTQTGWTLKFRHRRLLRFRAFRDPEEVLEASASPSGP